MSKTGTKSKKSSGSALTVGGPQPAWMTLNEARERAFTGEVVFEVEPEVLAYLDNGVVYYAERAADASLGRRLVDAGVIDASQLERGTVRVGDVEHLGRLFDRDPSVDRDAVLVVAEAETEVLISQLANEAITTIRVTAYRHHPSGVHRWFVGPMEPAANPRPIGEVAQLDTTVVDDLPGLPVASAVDGGGELTIEWEESLDGFEELEPLPALDEFDASMLEAMLDGGAEVDVEIISDTPEDDVADWDESVEALFEFTTEPSSGDVVEIDPQGLVEETESHREDQAEAEAEPELQIDVHDDLVHLDADVGTDVSDGTDLEELVGDEPDVASPDVQEIVAGEVAFEEIVFDDAEEVAIAGEVTVEKTLAEETVVDPVIEDEESVWEAEPSDEIVDPEFQVVWPDDVNAEGGEGEQAADAAETHSASDAVAESIATETPIIQTTADGLYFEMPPLNLSDEQISAEEVPDDVADAVRRAIAAIESAAVGSPSIAPIENAGPGDIQAPAATPLHAFAPPSMDTSAEALYSQWEASAAEAAAGTVSDAVSVEFDSDTPTGSVEDDADERSSALRRLIGSLRRKNR